MSNYYEMASARSKHARKRQLLTTLITVGVLAVLSAIIIAIWPDVAHSAAIFLRVTWLTLGVPLVLVVAAIVLLMKDRVGFAFLTGVGAVAAFIVLIFIQGYTSKSNLAESVTVVDESPSELSFDPRQPYDVATATSNRTLGDTLGTVSGRVRALPATGEDGLYTTSVIRHGFLQGYESTQVLDLPQFGTSDASNVRFCDWDADKAPLRLGGGLPANSLQGAIYRQTSPTVSLDDTDAFVVCQATAKPGDETPGDIPVLYAPLKKLGSGLFPYWVPAGVAVYDGKDGKLTILDELSAPGYPLYPSSIATAQRESTTARGSVADYIWQRVGWEDTGKDESDPNGYNRAEFGLSVAGKNTHTYVTPLNTRGSSSSIVGVGTSSAGSIKTGELNPYEVRLYPKGQARQANSAISDSITGGVLQGYQAQGLSVFEVVPEKDGNWVATIGKKQSVLYRATIAPDESITLVDAGGQQIGNSVTVNPDGEVDREVDPSKPTDGDADSNSTSIANLSDEELRLLGQQIIEELSKRSQITG